MWKKYLYDIKIMWEPLVLPTVSKGKNYLKKNDLQ